MARLQLGRTARIPLVAVVEVLRGAPVVILVYLCVRALPDIGLDFRSWYGGRELWGLVIGLTLYNMVVFAEIVRAGVASLPRGQREAAPGHRADAVAERCGWCCSRRRSG